MKKSIYVFALVGILGACGTSEVNPDVLTYNGKTYKTVKIGEQVWMAENLNEDSESSFCYDDDPLNCTTYGRLYNWQAAMDIANKIDGWHLPTDDEWKTLERHLGMSENDVDRTGQRSSGGVAAKLGEDGSSGFNTLLGGRRSSFGNFNSLGKYGSFWSSSLNVSSVWARDVNILDSYVYRFSYNQSVSFSARLIKD